MGTGTLLPKLHKKLICVALCSLIGQLPQGVTPDLKEVSPKLLVI